MTTLRKYLIAPLVALIMAFALTGPASAAHQHTRVEHVTARFTAAADVPVLPTMPRGEVVFRQIGKKPYGTNPITGTINVSGLAANTMYVTVPYKDPVCSFTPGVSAFPSSVFTTNGEGKADVKITVNPRAINPAGRLNIAQTRSVSIRQVVLPGQTLPSTGLPSLPPIVLPVLGSVTGPITVPTATPVVPSPVEETCTTTIAKHSNL